MLHYDRDDLQSKYFGYITGDFDNFGEELVSAFAHSVLVDYIQHAYILNAIVAHLHGTFQNFAEVYGVHEEVTELRIVEKQAKVHVT